MPGILDRLAALESDVKTLDGDTGTAAKGTAGSKTKNAEKVGGAPHARKGESVLSSRPFSFLKLAGAMAKVIDHEQAKVEAQVAEIFHKSFGVTGDYKASVPGSVMAPLGCDYLPESHRGEAVFQEIKALVTGGTAGADPDEMAWLAKKAYGMKAQSWLNEVAGGAIVAPPEQGELIDLFRNKDALVNAGARTVPLPPQGRVQFPRQTAASQGYWVGENDAITESQVKTGTLTLSAKKVGCLIKTPNELIRYGGPAAEALFRLDMTKTLTLTADKQLLDGQGSDTRPMGLLNTPGIATVTPTTVAANGNTLAPEDIYSFMSAVEENNATFEGWVMRPALFYALYKKRGGTGAGAGTGPFLFDMMRTFGQGVSPVIAGYPATLTPQVSNTRSKGNATNLTFAVGGMWSDFLMGMFGAIEFAATAQGDTSFANDQTWIRAILSVDGGARHPGAFAVADHLVIG